MARRIRTRVHNGHSKARNWFKRNWYVDQNSYSFNLNSDPGTYDLHVAFSFSVRHCRL